MEWISVKDRMPPKDTEVLCYYSDQYMDVMEYCDDDEQGRAEFFRPPAAPVTSVTHWMPLSNPPKSNI